MDDIIKHNRVVGSHIEYEITEDLMIFMKERGVFFHRVPPSSTIEREITEGNISISIKNGMLRVHVYGWYKVPQRRDVLFDLKEDYREKVLALIKKEARLD